MEREREPVTAEHAAVCEFLALFGRSTLGRVLADQNCDLSREPDPNEPIGTCQGPAIDAMEYTWAFAWGMAYALQKPEWAHFVMSEFSTSWSRKEWAGVIDELVARHAVSGPIE